MGIGVGLCHDVMVGKFGVLVWGEKCPNGKVPNGKWKGGVGRWGSREEGLGEWGRGGKGG